MGAMSRRGSARLRRGLRGHLAALLAAAVTSSLVSACTSEASGPDAPTSAALRVTTHHGSGLDPDARAGLESEVGDVLAHYVEAGFLGDYPRSDFVQSFADFTSGAAEQAVGDIDVLTASRFADATSVRATDLAANLSFYVVDGRAVGATAWIDFTFDVDDRGSPKTAALAGRLVLDRRNGHWSVFGYDVHRHDSDALPTEVASS
jgi:hypothetical protein